MGLLSVSEIMTLLESTVELGVRRVGFSGHSLYLQEIIHSGSSYNFLEPAADRKCPRSNS